MAAKRYRSASKTAESSKFRTADSFQNFIARVGHGTGNQQDGSHYGFNPVTRNRLQMEWCYRGSWVAGRVVDCVARDMTREGVDINTDRKTDEIAEFDKGLSRLKIWAQLCDTIKWARLYGGACGFMMIDGQDPKTPLRVESIGQGQFKGILPMDRWLLNPSLQDLVDDYGPHFGKPKYYQTVPDSMGMPLLTIHHTRMIRMDGVILPYWQKITENLWGQSVLERMWDRLLAFDSTTTGAAQLVYKAHLRTLKIDQLREAIGQGGKMMNGILAQINQIRALQTIEGLTVLDKTDEFDTHQYTFAGLDDILVQFGEQLCGAVEIPAVRLFGQSPAGFNSGDSDLRSYYDSIKQNQEADLGPEIETMYRVAYLSEFGYDTPKKWSLEFEHLWQMTEEQKANVTKTTTDAILDAYERQAIDRATTMKELKELSNTVGTFGQIQEEAITEAENDPPPSPEALGLVMPEKPEMGGEPPDDDDGSNKVEYKPDDAKPFKALDSAEDVVPRHEQSGRFTFGMGLDEKRFDEKGRKDDEGEWAENPLDMVQSKSIREAIQAAHPHTCKAYGSLGEIEPWKLQSHQKLINIKKVGEYRREHGEPITVVKRAGEHGIVDGHHRAVAAHLQGRNVEAHIVDMDNAFAEAEDAEAANPGLGMLGALHLATQLRLKNTPTKTKDSWGRKLINFFFGDAWEESKHPRQPDGKFGEKGTAFVAKFDWKKVGEKKGSNEGGTYQLNGDKKFYVKFPANYDQARTEVLASNVLRSFGIKTTNSFLTTIDGKGAVASQIIEDLSPIAWPDAVDKLNSEQREQLARMYYMAKATKNWDVLGVDLSNIMMDKNGNLVQMDTGGSFEFRAQGKIKPYGNNPDDTDLLNTAQPSGKVFKLLLDKDPGAFAEARQDLSAMSLQGADEAFDNSFLAGSKTLKLNFLQRLNTIKGVKTEEFNKPFSAKESLAKQIEKNKPAKSVHEVLNQPKLKKGDPGYKTIHQRLREAMKTAYESGGHNASEIVAQTIKAPPPPVTDSNVREVSRYVSSSTALNMQLRQAKGDLEKVDSVYKKQIGVLDGVFKETKDYAIPIRVMRGMPNHAVPEIKEGETFVDHGYQSTSFSGEVAKSFGSQNTVLQVTLPKGFKFLSIPSYAQAAMKAGKTFSQHSYSEAEAILPRGVGYRVKKIEMHGKQRFLHVDAVFSAIQPPGTEWKSTRAKKLTKVPNEDGV